MSTIKVPAGMTAGQVLAAVQRGRSPEPEPLLTPAEVAIRYRCDVKTTTRWAKAGKLHAIRTRADTAASSRTRSTPCCGARRGSFPRSTPTPRERQLTRAGIAVPARGRRHDVKSNTPIAASYAAYAHSQKNPRPAIGADRRPRQRSSKKESTDEQVTCPHPVPAARSRGCGEPQRHPSAGLQAGHHDHHAGPRPRVDAAEHPEPEGPVHDRRQVRPRHGGRELGPQRREHQDRHRRHDP